MTSTGRQNASILLSIGRAGLALGLVLLITSCGSPYTPAASGPPPGPPPAVVVTPAAVTLHRGETQQFAAQVTGSSDQTVTWSADAGLGSIDSTGLYTAPSDFDGTAVMVKATSNAAPGTSGIATVTLPTVPFTIAPNPTTVAPSASLTFSATVVGLANTQVGWTIQGTSGGTITNAGLYTAPSSSGIFSVVATSSANAHYSASATVLVTTTPGAFSATGNQTLARDFNTPTLLAGGKLLVAGGGVFEDICSAGTDSSELYDPGSGSFASTGNMTVRRYAQTSTLLQNGEVLLSGGFSFDANACITDGTSPVLKSAELYDPSNGSFASTGSMAEERGGHTATLLANGKVLVAGGGNSGGGRPPFFGDGSATAELYDPATRVFTSTGSMATARVGQTATLLASGEVLIAGGLSSANFLATAELYNPATGVFTSTTGSMTTARAGHTATILQDGRVLITGGFSDQTLAGVATAEIYDPATHSFVATGSMALARWSHTATLLPNATVLVVGGEGLSSNITAEVYDPLAGSFQPLGFTQFPRSAHSATLLQNGKVIVIGGLYSLTTAELYP